MKTAAVIGAGAIGLTNAIFAQQAGFLTTIYAENPAAATTSAKAAASFKPAGINPSQMSRRVLERSWDYFERLSIESPESGVRLHVHWEASSRPIPYPWYLYVMQDPVAMERPLIPGGYPYGWRYTTFFIDTSVFLPWLSSLFLATGGVLRIGARFSSIHEAASLLHDVVFVCVGCGARDLCQDGLVSAIKGQTVLVGPRLGMDWSINHDGFNVYPRLNDTVLGGTREVNCWNETPESGTAHAILMANRRVLPDLELADVRGTFAGLRPHRTGGIRLESEIVNVSVPSSV